MTPADIEKRARELADSYYAKDDYGNPRESLAALIASFGQEMLQLGREGHGKELVALKTKAPNVVINRSNEIEKREGVEGIRRFDSAKDVTPPQETSGVSEAPSDRVEYAHNIPTDCIVDPPRAAGKQAWPSEEEENAAGNKQWTSEEFARGWMAASRWLKARMEGK